MDTTRSMKTPLKRVRGLGSAKSGTDHFWKQRLTALAGVPLTIVMVVVALSLVGKDATAAKAVLSHPLVAIPVILFFVSTMIHMRIGMQVIVEDYVHEEGPKVLLLALNAFFSIAVGLAGIFAVLKLSFGA
jgi:succinate dehydrogenase / fumarate reductase membrane anchor subunit